MIRCVPGSESVLAGYLYAFLSSTPAQVLIRQRTYGSVVQHIEPAHIADLPVPILDKPVQLRISELVARAAEGRALASRLLDEAGAWFDGQAPAMHHRYEHSRARGLVRAIAWGAVLTPSTTSAGRQRRRSKASRSVASQMWLRRLACHESMSSGAFRSCRASTYSKSGRPFAFVWQLTSPHPSMRWSTPASLLYKDLGSGMASSGGVAYIGQQLDGWAASHDLFRIVAGDPATTARIFAYLRSDVGHRAMLRHSYGTSIPHVNPSGIAADQRPAHPTRD